MFGLEVGSIWFGLSVGGGGGFGKVIEFPGEVLG